MNTQTGYVGIGNVLTKEIDGKGGVAHRVPLDFKESEELCIYANKNYTRARHVVVEVCHENNQSGYAPKPA